MDADQDLVKKMHAYQNGPELETTLVSSFMLFNSS
jgi:hypothetical protein